MPVTTTRVDKIRQVKARAAAKKSRRNEAGLGGRRTGKASASNKRAQARRDSRRS